MSAPELVLENDTGVVYKSNQILREGGVIHWNLDTYVKAHTCATLKILQALSKVSVVQIEIEFKANEFRDCCVVLLQDRNNCVAVNVVCGRSKSLADVTRALGSWARADLVSTAPSFLRLPQVAALPPPTSRQGYNAQYSAIHWLNDDILLGIFDCYRLDEKNGWNVRLGWCKLSHVCQRWRHLIYEYANHLGMHIPCRNNSTAQPTLDTPDHLPPLPLFVNYCSTIRLTKQDELRIYHVLRLRDRVCHIELYLQPFNLHKVVMLMDENFPILDHLSLSFAITIENSHRLTLPKGFLAPNLRHLSLPGISPPRRLQVLTSTAYLVKLVLSDIESSSYFRPRLLVARLRSLPLLEELFISFSIPIPRPSTEGELLTEQGARVALPSLKNLWFKGTNAYVESLAAQIRTPVLERLEVTLFNQVVFVLPHLSHLINTTEAFKLPNAAVLFGGEGVSVSVEPSISTWSTKAFRLRVICKPLDWQIDCAAQICHALIPALFCVEKLMLCHDKYREIPLELRDGAIDSATWHDLLRSFIAVQRLCIDDELSEELARALPVDGVRSGPGFLPNLWSISITRNLFTQL